MDIRAYAWERRRRIDTKNRRSIFRAAIVFAWAFAPWAGLAGEAKHSVITIEFIETHDRLDPDPKAGISRSVKIEATLSGDGQVHENDVSGFGRGKKHNPGWSENENDEKLGDTSSKVVWRVEGPHKLQRLVVGKQFLTVADVDVGQDGSCSVQIKYLLQKGYSEVIMRRRDNGEFAKFSLPRVLSSSCSIQ